ncbi:ribulose-phosphate 3-epimerase [Companilactobacillus nuruki]|uniref:Ribulose-phosphate 3-epimerase n=1 Tax=Companilactobacillus nuruki TaxID=1993540 RepID=A0A2N7AVK7_9LACO|nr:ribulose-phosphate 3-epimerase [Companilactobacillus nuruki]PMD72195.1 ribulose-phosphate 3-epimerase [Companilactobacillus nuruki]
MKRLICPSLMCADFTNIKSEVNELDQAGTDIFHMDVMDGAFVPNMALGLEDYKAVRSLTKLPMDVHLMVNNPQNIVPIFEKLGANIIYIHPDTDPMPSRTIDEIKTNGIHPGIAINPGTSIETIKELLPLVDYVLVMTVNPGFSGQSYLEYVNDKIKHLAELKNKYDFNLMVDGAISPEKIKLLSDLGVDGFIVGTSSLFGKDKTYKEIIKELKEL